MPRFPSLNTFGRTPSVTVASSTASNSTSYDYVCDGVSDEVEILAAINKILSLGGGTVHLSEGTFVLAAALQAPNPNRVWLRGSGNGTIIDSSALNLVGGALQFFESSASNPTTTLTANANRGVTSFAVADATNFAANDWILIRSETVINPTTGNKFGELVQIVSVVGLTITVNEPLLETYTVAASATIEKHVLVEDFVISQMRIIGNAANGTAAALRIAWVKNAKIFDLRIDAHPYASILLENSLDSEIYHNTISGSTAAGLGYGLAAAYTHKNLIFHHNVVRDSVKICTIGGGGAGTYGIAYFSYVHHNYGYNTNRGAEGHGEDKYTIIAYNTHSGGNGTSFGNTGQFGRILYNTAYNCGNDGASSDAALSAGYAECEIIGNRVFWNPQNTNGQEWGLRAPNAFNITIRDNYFDGFKVAIILQSSLGAVDISRNIIINPMSGGIGIHFDCRNSNSVNVNISDNIIECGGSMPTGIQIECRNATSLSNLSIKNNKIRNPTLYGIYLYTDIGAGTSINRAQITNNHIIDDQGVPTMDIGFYVNAYVTDLEFTGNSITGGTVMPLQISPTSIVTIAPGIKRGLQLFKDRTAHGSALGWVAMSGAVIASDAAVKRIGTASLRVTAGGPANGQIRQTLTDYADLANKIVTFVAYVRSAIGNTELQTVFLNDGPGGTPQYTLAKDDTWHLIAISMEGSAIPTTFFAQIFSNYLNADANDLFYINGALLYEGTDIIDPLAKETQRFNSGTATVLNGATTIVVPHELGLAPTRVFLTARLWSNSVKAWVTGLDATNFTINVDADPGAGTAIFDWTAQIGES